MRLSKRYLILKESTPPGMWVLLTPNLTVFSGPVRFTSKLDAQTWANAFASSWADIKVMTFEEYNAQIN